MDDTGMQQGRFVGNLGGLVRVQVGDDEEWEQAVLSIELGKESRISLTEALNESTSSHDTDIFYECFLRKCTVMVPTDGWMDDGTAESSHDFVICPSDTTHHRRRIRPAEGEDLDIWVSLMKAGGARLRLVKSVDNLPPDTPRGARRAVTCPGSETTAASQQQQQDENRPRGGTGKDEDQWGLESFFHSVWGGLIGAVGGKGNDDSRAEGDKEERGKGEDAEEEGVSPALSTPSSSGHSSSRGSREENDRGSSPGSIADSVDSVSFMRQNPAYLLEEEPLDHDREDSLPTRIDTCTHRAMLDSLSDGAAPGPVEQQQEQQQHDDEVRGGRIGSLSSSMDLSLGSDISLHNNSIFSSEDSCYGTDAPPLAMIPSPSKPFLSPSRGRHHELHQMKLSLPRLETRDRLALAPGELTTTTSISNARGHVL